MLSIIHNFWRYINAFQIRNTAAMGLLVAGGIVLMLLELVGISALFPLLMLVLDPEIMQRSQKLQTLAASLGITQPMHMAIVLGLGICSIYSAKGLFHAAYWRFEFNTLAQWRIRISSRFYNAYVNARYEKIIDKNSADFINIISNIIPYTINNFVFQFISLSIYALTGLVLIGYIVYLNWVISAVVVVFGGGLLWLHTRLQRDATRRLGAQARELTGAQFSVLQQSFTGFKETKLHLREAFFAQRYRTLASDLAKAEQKLMFLQQLPGVTVELVIIVLVVVIFAVLHLTGEDMKMVGAQLGTMVLASFRIIPIVNRSITALILINSSRDPLQQLFKEYEQYQVERADSTILTTEIDTPNLLFTRALKLHDLSYAYPGKQSPDVLSHINFTLTPGQSIGITGPSGGGKTTFVHILLGFLDNFRGQYTIDDAPITATNIRSLRKIIGFVDQQIFVLDGTIADNVAFGVKQEEIDLPRVENALRKAQLWDFVSQQEKGMLTPVGENGKRLSGGQRQRLGIARALYRNIRILILDEASAALDVETEYNLFSFLETLRGELTIIMVAHRLSTLKNCDRIDFFDGGRIADSGSFAELYQRNDKFRMYIDYSQIDVGNAA